MKKMMFKIWDNQLRQYFHNGQWFTEKEAIKRLESYHDIDYSGQRIMKDEFGNELRNEDGKVMREDCTIYEFLDTIDEKEKLPYLLEYGDWDTHHCIFREGDVCYGGEYYREDVLQEYIADHPDMKNIQMEMRFYFDN